MRCIRPSCSAVAPVKSFQATCPTKGPTPRSGSFRAVSRPVAGADSRSGNLGRRGLPGPRRRSSHRSRGCYCRVSSRFGRNGEGNGYVSAGSSAMGVGAGPFIGRRRVGGGGFRGGAARLGCGAAGGGAAAMARGRCVRGPPGDAGARPPVRPGTRGSAELCAGAYVAQPGGGAGRGCRGPGTRRAGGEDDVVGTRRSPETRARLAPRSRLPEGRTNGKGRCSGPGGSSSSARDPRGAGAA